MNVNLHIERLILDALPVTAAQGPLVQAAMEAELARLFAAHGLAPNLQRGFAAPHAPGGTIQLTDGNDAGGIGRQVAQSVYGAIGK